jgi:hypothetical protein
MPRGKPAKNGRGGPGRGGRGGRGGARSASAPVNDKQRVAKPAVKTLPDFLNISISNKCLPKCIEETFTEFTNPQPFFSSIERLNPEINSSGSKYTNCWLGAPNITAIARDDDSAFNATLTLDGDAAPRNVFVKRIHLLDPISAMEGDYVWPRDGALPAPSEPWRNALTKINDPLNEAYVDALFAAAADKLVESGVSPHWCRSYGTFSARVNKYLYNITDEYASMRHKPWWRRNMRLGYFKTFDPNAAENPQRTPVFSGAGMALEGDDFENLDAAGSDGSSESGVTEDEPEMKDEASVQLSVPPLRLSRISNSSSSGKSGEQSGESGTEEDDDTEEEDDIMYAEFADFPVQVTLLERAEGTLDELLDDEEDDPSLEATRDARWSAWLWQIIAALSTAQHYYGFVHNDLHTNNIMWNTTDADHLYYRIQQKGKAPWIAKVPTYGRLMKIIDFGRATFTLPEPAGFFISDAFYPGNDAGEQYNCEPFYDDADGPRVEPNPSFDLCRLAVSLLESLYPERPAASKPVKTMSREGAKIYTETVSPVYNMLWEWLQDDSGKNVLRKPDGDERYPDFDLYKAISADVHNAVPCKQLLRQIFSAYRCEAAPEGAPIYDLYIE